MISNATVQAGLITYLKSKASVTVLLANTNGVEIREDQWQGNQFYYPAVRVRLDVQIPDANCNMATMLIAIQCFSEADSSREADVIASAVNDVLHEKQFTSGDVRYMLYSEGLVPAIRQDEQTWRSEALFRTRVQPA